MLEEAGVFLTAGAEDSGALLGASLGADDTGSETSEDTSGSGPGSVVGSGSGSGKEDAADETGGSVGSAGSDGASDDTGGADDSNSDSGEIDSMALDLGALDDGALDAEIADEALDEALLEPGSLGAAEDAETDGDISAATILGEGSTAGARAHPTKKTLDTPTALIHLPPRNLPHRVWSGLIGMIATPPIKKRKALNEGM